MENFPVLSDFLVWLFAGGGSIAVISWIMERVKWFQTLTSEAREWLMFALSTVVGVGAYVVVNYVPAETLELVSPYFAIVASIFGVVFLGKAFHKVDKR